MSNILEEYLVRIGAEVDKDAFAGAAKAINNLSGMLGKLGSILKYGAIFAGLAKVTEAVIDNIKAVASADLEYQKLAQSMWVTKDTAKTLSVVLKTMGASQEDVAWVPELREQFFRLRQEMAELSTPADADNQLAWIREIGYDVQSLQLKLKMFKEWVVYYLIKELQPYIKEFQEFIRWLNDKFGKSLPALARKVASVLASVVRVTMSLVKALKWLFEGIYNFIDALPSKTKALVAVFAVVGAAIMAGPFGLMMMAIGTALIMLEDFFGYLEGRESSNTLKPLWKWLTDENNPLRRLIEKLKEGIAFILEKLTELFEKVFTEERQEKLKKTVANIAKGVAEIAEGLATIVESIFGKKYPVVKKFWDFFLTAVGKVVDKVLALTNSMGHLMRALGKAMQGDVEVQYTDQNDYINRVRFFRPVYKDIFVKVVLKKYTGYISTMTVKVREAVYNYLAALTIGSDVSASVLSNIITDCNPSLTKPIFGIKELKLGLSKSSMAAQDIDIGFKEIPNPAYANIEVTLE